MSVQDLKGPFDEVRGFLAQIDDTVDSVAPRARGAERWPPTPSKGPG